MGIFKSVTNWIIKWINKSYLLRRFISKYAINWAINRAPHRPNPYSQLSNYTSWDSLTDRSYTGRHLPADLDLINHLPEVDDLLPLYRYANPEDWTPSKRSSLLFSYFAQWFTDGFLRTKRIDSKRLQNESNHDIDLGPLYGLNKDQNRVLRSFKSGRLKSQMIKGEEYPLYLYGGDFSEEDIGILNMETIPKGKHADTLFAMGGERSNIQIGYVMFNTLFLREHNRICSILEKEYKFDDERLFQTARMILISILLKLVVEEYINHISATDFQLVADPLSFSEESWHRQNWMTVEFNLLYRWHSLTPSQVLYDGNKIPIINTLENNELITDRGLGPLFDESSRQACGEIGLHNTWDRLVDWAEKKGLEQARDAELASYNSYREAFKLKKLKDFSELTSDKKLQQELTKLYGHIDNLEFTVGIFAEDKKEEEVIPGLMGRMVAVDAFSQALNNPLFAPRIFNANTFTKKGMKMIKETNSIADILHRNVPLESTYAVSLSIMK